MAFRRTPWRDIGASDRLWTALISTCAGVSVRPNGKDPSPGDVVRGEGGWMGRVSISILGFGVVVVASLAGVAHARSLSFFCWLQVVTGPVS